MMARARVRWQGWNITHMPEIRRMAHHQKLVSQKKALKSRIVIVNNQINDLGKQEKDNFSSVYPFSRTDTVTRSKCSRSKDRSTGD